MAAAANSKKNSTSNGTKRSYKKSASKDASASRSKNAVKATKARREKAEREAARSKRLVEILLILVVCLSLLMFVSCFVPALSWLRNICFFAFGYLMYVFPFVFIAAGFLLTFDLSETGIKIRRTVGVLLILFAVSGLVGGFTENAENGGLLGRLNDLILYKNMGIVGCVIVNIALILIGIVLLTEFSLFNLISRRIDEARSRQKIINESHEVERLTRDQEKAAEREARLRERLSERQNARAAELKAEHYRKQEERRKRENEQRFTRVFGIVDTTICDDGTNGNGNASFIDDASGNFNSSTENTKVNLKNRDTKSISKENASLFNQAYNDSSDASLTNASVYGNSGNMKAKLEKDDDFMPEITIAPSYFSTDGQVDRSEDVFREPKLDSGDSYVKTVITSNGKTVTSDTNHDLTARKNAVQEGNVSETHTDVAEALANNRDNTTVEKPEAPEPTKPYKFPPMSLLSKNTNGNGSRSTSEIKETAQKLQNTFQNFGVGVTVTHVTCGPAVTRYELQPDMGVKVRKILEYTDDIKLNLAATDIRVEAPIPGKSAIGIEVPNKVKQTVTVREIMETDKFKTAGSKLSFTVGKDIEGNGVISDIAKMPHLLVAGTTGSGKSVCINSMIMSVLYHATPEDVKMVLIDPKMVELSVYKGIPHLLMPVVIDSKKAGNVLNAMVNTMEKRYELYSELGVRNIEGYNELIDFEAPSDKDGKPLKHMPMILIVVDELADLMMVAKNDIETAICRLAQKGRACGMHLVIATQRPSVNVITGLIKANIPSRIAFAVSSGFDSRTILDMEGAENLLGRGDMLYYPQGATKPVRIQGCFVDDEEIHKVVEFILAQGPVKGGSIDPDIMKESVSSSTTAGGGSSDKDDCFEESGRLIIEKQKASIGMLQRAFKLGFNRAARIMDSLAEAGVVGEEDGTKPREILMTMEQFEAMLRSQK